MVFNRLTRPRTYDQQLLRMTRAESELVARLAPQTPDRAADLSCANDSDLHAPAMRER